MPDTAGPALAARAADLSWYHTIELAPGVVTDGHVDLRPHVDRYGLPERMDGMRALDVGTFDGFWAFEMERRGAEVVAIDLASEEELDWPAARRPEQAEPVSRRQTFDLAREALGASVEYRELSVYDASPDILGEFDLVFCGSILIHLRDQPLALERLATVCAGRLVAAEAYHRWLSLLPFALAHYRALRGNSIVIWEPNVRAWRRMIASAGFSDVEVRGRFTLRGRAGWRVPHVVLHARR